MTTESEARVGSNAIVNESRTRAVTLGRSLAAGPHQEAARAILAPFESVAYVYASLDAMAGDDDRELRSRRAREELLKGGASEQATSALTTRLTVAARPAATLAAFVCADGALLHEQVMSGADLADDTGVRSPAPVLPLLAWGQDRPPFLLVVTDRAGADLTASPGAGQREQTFCVVGPDDEIERKHGPGGWSQPSYQHRVEDSWRHNAARVAQEVTAHAAAVGAQVLVLSGDVRAVQLLSDRLTDDPAVLVRHISGSRAADGSQASRASRLEAVLREAADTQTARLLDALQEHLEPGGLAVEGVEDTVEALANGRVATLLVQAMPGDPRTAWFGAGPTEVYPDHDAAVLSGVPVRQGHLVDVATRSALLAGAHVRVIPPGTPGEPAGGIGAICRYRTP